MTNEEAHRVLSNGLINAPSEHEWCIAFRMAIKALEQQPCEDCISREAVLDILCENKEYYQGESQYDRIEKLPSITPQPKIGHWIAYTDHQACSCCGNWIAYYENDFNYCPNCGAKMEGKSKTEQALAYADQDTLMPAT